LFCGLAKTVSTITRRGRHGKWLRGADLLWHASPVIDDGAASDPMRPRHPADFAGLYAVPPPWDIGRPQPALQAVAERGDLRGAVLDAGCGTGEHALLAAAMGFDATGVDTSAAAIGLARAKAAERGLTVRFSVANVLDLPALGLRFDTVIDSALFHVLVDADRAAYVSALHAVLRPGGRYFMLCFSEREPGDYGPRRVSQAEIRDSFTAGWRVDSIEPADLATTIRPEPVPAWLATLTRI
jgi:SAM-dependent methyltransferase